MLSVGSGVGACDEREGRGVRAETVSIQDRARASPPRPNSTVSGEHDRRPLQHWPFRPPRHPTFDPRPTTAVLSSPRLSTMPTPLLVTFDLVPSALEPSPTDPTPFLTPLSGTPLSTHTHPPQPQPHHFHTALLE
ncbi:hypothetical protein M427DRAFT_157274 [Gonapodya prolifera JEL478]|uniref:Uncharacterized protein n=1 Tax=Gonapodya prolifera (strain JEL478) TaxID=1344416 RepID=A0A139A7U6_GONPJ|nr:hypothetical protein M427DRAFT_157274 [Gonapodya prolifera JEL478]|eukprot:KXS12515.1 hypothetical protein M427DRAFT_157274 [Gonapodya prolifera JEL478]